MPKNRVAEQNVAKSIVFSHPSLTMELAFYPKPWIKPSFGIEAEN